jgi:hypothetical protein
MRRKCISYGLNWSGGLWIHLPTLSRSCGSIKRKADERNVDMILYYVNLIIFIWVSCPNLKMLQHILLILY